MNIDKSVNVYTYCTTNFLLITTNFEFQGDFKPLREWLRTNVHEIGEMKYFHYVFFCLYFKSQSPNSISLAC